MHCLLLWLQGVSSLKPGLELLLQAQVGKGRAATPAACSTAPLSVQLAQLFAVHV
jgi:hypothetical protein